MEGRLKYTLLDKFNPSPPIGYQEGVKQTWSRRLYKSNYYLMLLHALATLSIVIVSARIDPQYTVIVDTLGEWKMWILMAVVEFITAFNHWLCWYNHDTYMTLLENELQPIRWVEYHITMSIVGICVASLSGITDVYLLTALFLIIMYFNFAGGLGFEVLRHAVRMERFNGPILTTLIFTQWYLFVMALLVFALQFATVGFVDNINWALFGTIIYFLLIHIYQTIAVQRNWKGGYYQAEFAYIVGSLASKSILIGSIFNAAIERENT